MGNETQRKEKRSIKTGEGKDVYIISFASDQEEQIDNEEGITLNIYPNPSNGTVYIDYELHKISMVTIEIFDFFGRKVNLLESNKQHPGKYQVMWNFNNNSGEPIRKGIYVIKLSTDTDIASKKIVIN